MPIGEVHERIVDAADTVFDRRGFHGSSMDALLAAAGVSSRTLYKHVGSKEGLIEAVLQARRERFFRALREADEPGTSALFLGLEAWFVEHDAHGCIFLRALAEFGEISAEVREQVARYDRQLRDEITERVRYDLGTRQPASPLDVIVDQVLVLFEGAASVATRVGSSAAASARLGAEALIAAALGGAR